MDTTQIEDIVQQFNQLGVEEPVGSSHRLDLNAPHSVWLVDAGKVDVFYSRVRKGQERGQLHHLLRMKKWQIFFGIDLSGVEEGFKLTAGALPESRVIRLPIDQLPALMKGREKAMAYLVEPWFFKFSASLITRGQPTEHVTFPANSERVVEPETVVLPSHGMLWFQNVNGTCLFSGETGLPAIESGRFVPVTDRSWLRVETGGEIHTLDTTSFLIRPDIRVHFDYFHQLGLRDILLRIEELWADEQARIEQRIKNNRSTRGQAALSLSVSLQPQAARLTAVVDESDPLTAAAMLVVRAKGVPVKSGTAPPPGNPDPIGAIARAWRVKSRAVSLGREWWKQDNGPLLGFLREDGRPVALIPKSSTSYDWIDPTSHAHHEITREEAKRLAPRAWQFYRPFPEEPLDFLAVAKYMFQDIRRDVMVVAACGSIGGLLTMATPFATGLLFDSAIPQSNQTQLMFIAGALVISAFASAMFGFTQNIAMLRAEGKMDGNLQAAVWDRLLSLPVPFFKDFTAGDLANRAMGVNTIRSILSESIVTTLISSIFTVFVFFQLVFFSPRLALVALGLVLVAMLPMGLSVIQLRYERRLAELEGKISGVVYEFISGISKLRVSGAETQAYAIWAKLFGRKKKIAYAIKTITNINAVWNGTFSIISLVTIFAFMSFSLEESEGLSTGMFLAFNAAYSLFLSAALSLSRTIVNSLSIIPLMERVSPILQAVPELDSSKASPGSLSGNIEVRHLSFSYNEEGPQILKDVGLTIRQGEFVAVVGASGSGKSTLLRLLLGFEKPSSGSIYFDGKDLAGVDIHEVRRQIGVVLQHSRLLTGDIFTNIVGSLPLTHEDAWLAARQAGLAADIEDMPMKMHTVVSEGGGTLSGGQRQRILIARALVNKPRILFLDEATSALDNETQAVVSSSLENLHVTRVVIAHRLSTIMNADRIFVMDKGVVAESGSYDELMEQDGLFAQLAKRQIA